MRNSRRSPINKLIKEYDIKKEELEHIAQSLKATSDEVLNIEELLHLTKSINSKFSNIIGGQVDSKVSLDTIDLDPTRILNSLKIMIGHSQRSTSDTSLGLTNILYISLILLSLEDKTVPFIIQKDSYMKLLTEQGSEILYQCYKENENGKYLLKDQISDSDYSNLYTFMEDNAASNKGFTILAIEEPESHLHPALQRVIYKDVMKNDTSILMTTHSPYITSVAPLESIVHLRSSNQGTTVKTTASLNLNDRDRKDLARYIDVKKGEIYFGKGVILVEGVAEEYLVPRFAELLNQPLDDKGLICCNINSTNFKPYVQYLNALGIPYVVITDGDYYHRHSVGSEKMFGDTLEKKHSYIGYDGLDRAEKLLVELEEINEDAVPLEFESQDEFFKQYSFFIGDYTLETDIMDISKDNNSLEVIIQLFEELTVGGDEHKRNFKDALHEGDYSACLRKIESAHSKIGKGRFSQVLSMECTKNNIPDYIKNAIETIYAKVDEI
ncbi:ATP-dependent endonuclease [Virgibacillus sp. CBA3643]|uniref:ATP-dependent nuclease n=1 Tax=Virgibacillus sp. CBA3643 TaxID=2942278 RepID=UPI0035A2AC83